MFWEDMSAKKASFKVASHVGEANPVVLNRARMLHDKVLWAQVHFLSSQNVALLFFVCVLCQAPRLRKGDGKGNKNGDGKGKRRYDETFVPGQRKPKGGGKNAKARLAGQLSSFSAVFAVPDPSLSCLQV